MNDKVKVEVLASVMNQKDYKIIEKMNINTDAVIINQCKENKISFLNKDGNIIKFFCLDERGIGLSRNTALMRASGDIVIFCDEDSILVDNYAQIIINEFKKNKKADMIVFNVPSLNKQRPTYNIKKNKRVHRYNCLRYGAVSFAIKLEKIREYNVYFSLLFGGGARYGSGEDSLFIYNFIKRGGRVFSSTKIIGYVEQKDSTWFCGYDKKYLKDKAILFKHLLGPYSFLYKVYFLIRNKDVYKENGFLKTLKMMK